MTVTFPDYIKNVASSELYPTWPENALRANIYAQISFALNRVFTEYYRSRGYDFDITNSTANDQSFVAGRDIFQNVSEIVDEIFNNYLVRRGAVEPLFAQYCNGTTVTCNGLSQWGTVDLANDGLTPYEILTYYYGDDIDIVYNAPVESITESVPIRPLRIGSVGNDVRTIEVRLNRISTNYPSIPKISTVDGVFDSTTEDAVRAFQEIFNLTPDGVVGKATWYSIQYIYNSVKRISELNSEGLTLEEVSRQFPETLSEGATGSGVSLVQFFLAYIARYNETIPPITPDGIFGPATRSAVEAFQRTYGLPVTGVVDDQTYVKLYDNYTSIISSIPPAQLESTARPYPGFDLVLGSENQYVTLLQQYLNTASSVYTAIPQTNVNGVFDAQTQSAVIAFQREFGLPQTGVVNLATWNRIASIYNDIENGNITVQGQYPGYDISS